MERTGPHSITIDVQGNGSVRVAVPHLAHRRHRAEVDGLIHLIGILAGGPMQKVPSAGWTEERVAQDRSAMLRILLDAHRRRSRVVAFPSPEAR